MLDTGYYMLNIWLSPFDLGSDIVFHKPLPFGQIYSLASQAVTQIKVGLHIVNPTDQSSSLAANVAYLDTLSPHRHTHACTNTFLCQLCTAA